MRSRLPSFDFSDCPAPPSNADPGTWRCEAFVSQGKLTIDGREIPLGELRLTFSEGRVNGQYAQAFGALRHEPVRVAGLAGATLQLRYGGYSDFQGNALVDQQPGLPSPSGQNTFHQTTYVQYQQL
ncbi:hypothetical protein [Amycolatopsis solani]|uniref:hypothetical protein n=1 Tax=Amycolatopsis solani TaxID=3028615 RepID=UPI0025B11480|nr:hypothetical protein [Amycolatopsis sp. MEP2-6]